MAQQQSSREPHRHPAEVVPIGATSQQPDTLLWIERAVLGHVLVFPASVHDLRAQMAPHQFGREPHRVLCQAIYAVSDQHGTADAALVYDHLGKNGLLSQVGGGEAFLKMARAVPLGSNFPGMVRRLLDAYRDRETARVLKRAVATIEAGEGAQEAVSSVLAADAKLEQEAGGQSCDDYRTQSADLVQRYLGGAEGPEPIRTGLRELDERISGLMPGDLAMLGARTGCGKSILALNLASHAAMQGKAVSFFALEMKNDLNFARLLSLHAKVDSRRIRQRTFSQTEAERIMAAAQNLQGWPLRFYDRVWKLSEILAIARSQKARGELDLLVIDHIHLVQSDGRSSYERAERTTTAFRELANELGIVVLCIAQFSGTALRGKAKDEAPVMEWLSGGAHMWTHPTLVLLLHRPDKMSQRCELIIEKGREGGEGVSIELAMLKEMTRFEDWRPV